MPMYEYSCPQCGWVFEEFYGMNEDSSAVKCAECKGTAFKRFTPPNLKTDTSFCLTGKYHMSVCDHQGDRIEGRADWQRRLQDKGLRELDKAELANPKMPTPPPLEMD